MQDKNKKSLKQYYIKLWFACMIIFAIICLLIQVIINNSMDVAYDDILEYRMLKYNEKAWPHPLYNFS